MSRCYPFPPPGYAGKCSSHEALILSIKLQKEKEKAVSACEGAKAVSNREKDKSKSSEKNKDKEQRKDKKRNRVERKEHKKDKEERKKEKKEKRAAKKAKIAAPAPAPAPADADKQNVVKQFSKVDDSLVPGSKGKLQGSSCELLERSIVTEEHGQPIESQNVPCSSDSTGNSGKRKKSSSSPSGIQNNGHIIRLRFSASKKDEPSTSGSKLQEVGPPQQMKVEKPYGLVRPCTTSGSKLQEVRPPQQMRVEKPYGLVRPCATNVKAESSVKQQNKDDKKPVSYVMQKDDKKPVSYVMQKDDKKPVSSVKQNRDVIIAEPSVKQNRDVVKAESSVKQKDIASTSRPLQPASSKDDTGSKGKNEKQLSSHETIQVREKMVAKLSSHDRRQQKKEAVYQNLFVDWAAPPPALERIIAMDVDEDEDWLFGKKNKDTSTDRLRGIDDSNVRCGASAVIQPRACFLADAEIYALPYTVPF